MEERPCDALREILQGKLAIRDFASPQVFTQGIYNEYCVTTADLRWHVEQCPTCFARANDLRHLFGAFDEEQFLALSSMLGLFEDEIRQVLREQVEYLASGSSEWLHAAGEGDDDFSNGEFIEARKDMLFQDVKPLVYLWALKIHAALGKKVARWLETLLPPAFPRTCVFNEGEIVDLRLDWTRGRLSVRLPQELVDLLSLPIPEAGKLLLRALFLREAFTWFCQPGLAPFEHLIWPQLSY